MFEGESDDGLFEGNTSFKLDLNFAPFLLGRPTFLLHTKFNFTHNNVFILFTLY